jgi:AcrR family transcriptional regulator
MKTRAKKLPAVERRRDIVEHAQTVFARLGYAGTATEDVANEAGIAPSTIYRYLDSKRELYLAALDAARVKLMVLWGNVDLSTKTPTEAIWQLGLDYYDHVNTRAPFARLWFQAMADVSDPDVRAAIAANFTSQVDRIAGLVETGKRTGDVGKSADSRLVAWQLMAIGLMFDLIHHIGLDDELDREKVERLGEFFVGSIRAGDSKREE